MEWITLSGVCFTVAVAVIGSAIRLTWWLSEKFTDMKDTYAAGLNEHEAKDQLRHEDNLQRFAAVDAKLATIIKNGDEHSSARRARKIRR